MRTNNRPMEITMLACLVLVVVATRILIIIAVIALPEVRDGLESLGVDEAENALIRLPLWTHYAVSVLGTFVLLGTGVGLLRARNWSRVVLVAWSGLALLFSFVTTGSAAYVAPTAIVYVLILLILFSPRAARYFNNTSGEHA